MLIIRFAELKNPWVLLATGFGSGLSPKAPGTAGTVAALLLFAFYTQTHSGWYLGLCVVSFALGVLICDRASNHLGVHDHGGIVWDEFVGMWLTMLWVPIAWQTLLVGFILFRLFDIIKPWPISWLDRQVSGGMGIMVDDVVAGIFANLCLQALIAFSILTF
jgi:phosphatidylglycerophosphatase A